MGLGKHANDCKRSNSPARISTASLGEPDGEGSALLVCRILKLIRGTALCGKRFPVCASLRCAQAYGVRKESFLCFSGLPFSSQARLGTVPGYYQPSRCAGLDLHATNGVEPTLRKSGKGWGTVL